VRLYADTHIPKQVAIQLRQKDIDIVRCEEVELAEADDNKHWLYAQQEQRTILTHDDDFLTLATQAWQNGETFYDVIYGGSQLQGKIGAIVNNCLTHQDDDLTNQVIYMRTGI
jgi:Domain of unknown function (DUF5615)